MLMAPRARGGDICCVWGHQHKIRLEWLGLCRCSEVARRCLRSTGIGVGQEGEAGWRAPLVLRAKLVDGERGKCLVQGSREWWKNIVR
jgi:hypothetical protein